MRQINVQRQLSAFDVKNGENFGAVNRLTPCEKKNGIHILPNEQVLKMFRRIGQNSARALKGTEQCFMQKLNLLTLFILRCKFYVVQFRVKTICRSVVQCTPRKESVVKRVCICVKTLLIPVMTTVSRC